MVGYMNGGVYGLTVATKEKLNTEYLGSGTDAMRSHNAFPRTTTLFLGLALLGCGIAALLFVGISGVISVRQIRKASHLTEGHHVMKDFLNLQKTVLNAAMFFESKVDPSRPLTPIRLSTALRWSGLEVDEFKKVPSELDAQTKLPGEQLLLILYNSRTRDTRTTISSREWNELVASDVEEREASRRFCCLRHTTDVVKDSQILGRGGVVGSSGRQDLFTTMMTYQPTTTKTPTTFTGEDTNEETTTQIQNFSDDERHDEEDEMEMEMALGRSQISK